MSAVSTNELADRRAELNDALRVRAEIAAQIRRRFPRGFDGNGVIGDFESLEMDWQYADREVRACREAVAELTGVAP